MQARDIGDLWDFVKEISNAQTYQDNRNNNYRVSYQNSRPQPQRVQPQREQPQRPQPQPQRAQSQTQPEKKEGSGFGYFLAGLVGVAAGLLFKSFLGEEE